MCGAQRYERSPVRVDTRAHAPLQGGGEVKLQMPKLRRQAFETAIIERYKRREASIKEALMEMYLAGVSERRVEDITDAMCGTRFSSGTFSKLNKKVYQHINGCHTWHR